MADPDADVWVCGFLVRHENDGCGFLAKPGGFAASNARTPKFTGDEIMDHASLISSRIRAASTLRDRAVARDAGSLEATDPAICALTDFELDFPITVDMEAPIDDAFEDMRRLDIHALLVTRQGFRGVDPQLVGLITAHEVERARPRLPPQTCVGPVRTPFRVCDVMTPWDELSLVKYQSLQTLTAMDLYETFQGTGLTHLLVVDIRDDDFAVARGVLSRAALAKRLARVRDAVAR